MGYTLLYILICLSNETKENAAVLTCATKWLKMWEFFLTYKKQISFMFDLKLSMQYLYDYCDYFWDAICVVW